MKVNIFKIFLYIFRERGREGEREGEKHQSIASLMPATQACSLTGNQTGDLSIYRTTPDPLSHTSQGESSHLETDFFFFSDLCCTTI